MGVRSRLQPRDPVGAARAISSLYSVGAGVALTGAIVTSHRSHSPLWFVLFTATMAIVVAAEWLLRRVTDGTSLIWTTLPLTLLAPIVALCVATPELTLHAEYFLWFPAMYFARQLPRRSAAWSGIAACAAVAAVVYALHYDARSAFLNTLYLDAGLVAVTVRLTLTGKRFDQKLSHAEQRATVDPLTGLLTRPVLEAATGSALAVIGAQRQAALALIDVDHFKSVNDTFGHPVGDTVLREIGEILHRECRSTDVVARIGGDELAILFTDLPADMMFRRVDALRAAIATHALDLAQSDSGLTAASVTVSIGVAHSRDGATTLAEIYSQADRALYSAKRRGRNCTEIIEATDDGQAYRSLNSAA